MMTAYVAARLNARPVSTVSRIRAATVRLEHIVNGTQEAPRYARASTQRAAQRHGGSSRLIII